MCKKLHQHGEWRGGKESNVESAMIRFWGRNGGVEETMNTTVVFQDGYRVPGQVSKLLEPGTVAGALQELRTDPARAPAQNRQDSANSMSNPPIYFWKPQHRNEWGHTCALQNLSLSGMLYPRNCCRSAQSGEHVRTTVLTCSPT